MTESESKAPTFEQYLGAFNQAAEAAHYAEQEVNAGENEHSAEQEMNAVEDDMISIAQEAKASLDAYIERN